MTIEAVEKVLIELGYLPTVFFYQVGGGEDESDMTIYVRGNEAIRYDWHREKWVIAKVSDLNYIDGWPEENQKVIDLNQFLKLQH